MREFSFYFFSFDCYCLYLPGQETSAFVPLKSKDYQVLVKRGILWLFTGTWGKKKKRKKKLEPNYIADAESGIYSPKPHRSFIKISVLISKHLFCVWFYTDTYCLQFAFFSTSN